VGSGRKIEIGCWTVLPGVLMVLFAANWIVSVSINDEQICSSDGCQNISQWAWLETVLGSVTSLALFFLLPVFVLAVAVRVGLWIYKSMFER
jgi:hypothetical protein